MRCVQPSRRSLHAARAVCPYDEVPIEAAALGVCWRPHSPSHPLRGGCLTSGLSSGQVAQCSI